MRQRIFSLLLFVLLIFLSFFFWYAEKDQHSAIFCLLFAAMIHNTLNHMEED